MNSHNRYIISIRQVLAISFVVLLNFINYLLILFLVWDFRYTVYPYADIENSLYFHVVKQQALEIRLLFTPITFIIESLSIWISLRNIRNKRKRTIGIVRIIFIFILVISVTVTLFCVYRYAQLWYINLSIKSCDEFVRQGLVGPGCYIP